MLRRTIFLLHCSIAVGLAGCYDPRPPPGAYSCEAAGAACPDGQRCVCGQCVQREEQAACAFTAEALVPPCADPPPSLKLASCVHEHEPFAIDVTALQKSGAVASTYAGSVAVSATWGDAHLHDARVEFRGGKATIHVSLNRETIGQSRARVIVRTGSASGATQGVAVVTRKLSMDKDALLLPQGWANLVTMMPSVVRDDAGALRMYFAGVGAEGGQLKNGIGIATPGESDARPWQMQARPALSAPLGDFAKDVVMGPAVYRAADGGWRMVFRGTNPGSEIGDLGLARSKDGLAGWELVSPAPILSRTACSFCMKGLDFPTVLADPAAPPGTLDLYFTTGLVNAGTDALGHAASIDDGRTWDVDPIRVPFAGSQGQPVENVGAAQIVREGSVYKMFYAYVVSGPYATALPCLPSLRLDIGYATSDDGVLFIRSPSNPVLAGAPPWATSAALVPGSPVLIDPSDPTKGILLYYSVVQTVKLPVGFLCVPSGIGRATRP